jgi:hypothetical protein
MMLILRRIRAHSRSPAYGAGGQDTIALPAHAEMPWFLCLAGPMFAGKSTELMRRIRRHRIAGRKCVTP